MVSHESILKNICISHAVQRKGAKGKDVPHYNLACPLCDKTTLQLSHCAGLTGRRQEYDAARKTATTNTDTNTANPAIATATFISLDKPSESDCPSFSPETKAITPGISYAPPNYAAWKHVCQYCDFRFWYKLDEEDEGGEEILSEEEKRRRNADRKVEAGNEGGC